MKLISTVVRQLTRLTLIFPTVVKNGCPSLDPSPSLIASLQYVSWSCSLILNIIIYINMVYFIMAHLFIFLCRFYRKTFFQARNNVVPPHNRHDQGVPLHPLDKADHLRVGHKRDQGIINRDKHIPGFQSTFAGRCVQSQNLYKALILS